MDAATHTFALYALAFLPSAGLSLIDLFRVFKNPGPFRPKERWWWRVNFWGAVVVGSNGLFGCLAYILSCDLVDITPLWAEALSLGASSGALLRSRFTTIERNGVEIAIGVQEFYDRFSEFARERINDGLVLYRTSQISILCQKSLKELASLAKNRVAADALAPEATKNARREWILATLQDKQASESDQKRMLALFLLDNKV